MCWRGTLGGTETNICPSKDATRFIQGMFLYLYMVHIHMKCIHTYIHHHCQHWLMLVQWGLACTPGKSTWSTRFNFDLIQRDSVKCNRHCSRIWFLRWWDRLAGLQKECSVMSNLLKFFSVNNSKESSTGAHTKFQLCYRTQMLYIKRAIIAT